MQMRDAVQQIIDEIATWEGITVNPHRFGGREFNLGKVEIGHIHSNGMVDIPYTVALRKQLLAEGRAEPHHLLPDTGWISFYLRQPEDIGRALWLYRVSYLHKARRRHPAQDWATYAAQLDLSESMQVALKL